MSQPRNPHAGAPFIDDAATIRAHLEDVSVPALLCSLVHMTGDPSWIRGVERPRMLTTMEFQAAMPTEEQAAVRDRAVAAIVDYRDRGCEAFAPSDALVREMMEFLAARPMIDARGAVDDGGAPTRRRRLACGDVARHRARSAACRIAGCRDRVWRVGDRRRHPPEGSGIAVHHRRARAGPGRHLAGESVPRRACRRRLASLLLFLRAVRRPGASISAASPSCSGTSSTSWTSTSCVRTVASTPKSCGPHGTTTRSCWRVVVRDAAGREDTIDARFVISAVGALSLPRLPRLRGHGVVRRSVVPLRAVAGRPRRHGQAVRA